MGFRVGFRVGLRVGFCVGMLEGRKLGVEVRVLVVGASVVSPEDIVGPGDGLQSKNKILC